MRTIRAWPTACAMALLATLPASAWDFGVSDSGDVFWTVVEDFTGETSLAFFCSQTAPGSIMAQFMIDQPGPSDVVPVELSFVIAGQHFGLINANADSADGMLVVSTNGDTQIINAAARAAYAEDDAIELTYYESAWRFPGADYSDSFGAMLDACG